MSYSTNPVLDQMRYQNTLDWAEAMREHKERQMYEETLALADRGDFVRLYEAMDYVDNDTMTLKALHAAAKAGQLDAKRAINTLARTYAQLFSEPT